MPVGKYITFVKNHTLSQIWNYLKYSIHPSNMSYLRYEPINLEMFITSNCNNHCNFCPQHAPSVPKNTFTFNDMTIDVFRKIVDRFKAAIFVNFSGGEPFLNKDIFKMIAYAHLMKMKISTSTNGYIIKDKIGQIMGVPLSTLNISLNADNPIEYARMNGVPKTNFNIVLDTITELTEQRKKRNSRIKLTISFVCTKDNYKTIPNMIHLAEDLNLDEIYFHNLIPFNLPGFSRDQSLYEDDSEVLEMIKSIESTTIVVSIPRLYRKIQVKRLCRAPFKTLPVTGEGHVSVCCQIISSQIQHGNVLQNNDVWNNTHFQNMRKILINKSDPLPALCKTCPVMIPSHKIQPNKKIITSKSKLT